MSRNCRLLLPCLVCASLMALLVACGGGTGGGGGDDPNVARAHAALAWTDYPGNCMGCHADEFGQVFDSTHYRWLGDTPEMANATGTLQGKLTNGVNSYCVNILGDWTICGTCHVGRGLRPDDALAGTENIDCLFCHNLDYANDRVRHPDGSMGPASQDPAVLDTYVRDLSKPTRAACLKCHAKAGGGDAVKRGDLSMATIDNSDPEFDVHMNTGGADLQCIACHLFEEHKTIGRGSDLRPSDDPVRGSEVDCVRCHIGKDTRAGHIPEISKHVDRVACQTCHIPVYAKVATEVHRDWTHHHDGSPADGVSGPGHPHTEKAADLVPAYLWWNRTSDNYLLGDDASLTYDAQEDTYPTSRPLGELDDESSKIYPFKYKTAHQPMVSADRALLALDTLIYLSTSGDVAEAIESGLVNQGYPADEPVEWVTTDTYQLLNHGIEPHGNALLCADCHDGSGETTGSRLPFAELGYHSWPLQVENCTLCHTTESLGWQLMHDQHVDLFGLSCQHCHTAEPTGLVEPATVDGLCDSCHDGRSYTDPQELHKDHTEEEHGIILSCGDCHTF